MDCSKKTESLIFFLFEDFFMRLQLDERKKIILENFRRSNQFSIIFICSGNIIRSPYAHLLFEHLLKDDKDLSTKIKVESGAVTYRNYSISLESHDELLKEGISSERIQFKPRHFMDYPDMFQRADLILVMAKGHLRSIPEGYRDKAFLLLEFTNGKSENIPDPYFNPPFSRAYIIIKNSLIQLHKFFLKNK
jgi:protein-tyrosine phosphatase